MKKKFGEWYLGLDIGTNSVGWCVTDPEYHVLKLNGKSLWGIRLFEEAQPAADRRAHRTARRRLHRRTVRIQQLQELFASAIQEVDPSFYQRLKESALYVEDRTIKQPNTLFCDEGFTDADFYKAYPTVYHLRAKLATETEPVDVRLLYLAIHHMMKHRGHFLFAGNNVEDVNSFGVVYGEFVEYLLENFDLDFEVSDELSLEGLLKEKQNRSNKKRRLQELYALEKDDKQRKAICGLMAGTSEKLSDIFDDKSMDELEVSKVCFADASYEDNRDSLEAVLFEKIELLDKVKAIYDWALLADILQGQQFLSCAKVTIYEQHKADLELLKKMIKQYCPEQFEEMFRVVKKERANYCAYVGLNKKNGKKQYIEKHCTQDEFCKYVKKIFEAVNAEDAELQEMLRRVEDNTFMPKQVTKSNSVIPYQVHLAELTSILKNAETYHPFLLEKDEGGRTVSKRIEMLFKFRIPYYVGPLNDAHREKDPITGTGGNSWIVKRSQEKITPWNFEDVVDLEASAENFIKRMTNKCTYLRYEDVVPKNSLLYCEYMVLNELNGVRLNGERLPVTWKQCILDELFCARRKVTVKQLKEFLVCNGMCDKEVPIEISGLNGDFKSSLGSYHDFKRILGDRMSLHATKEMVENIILWRTLYGEDDTLLKNKIKKEYREQLSSGEIKKILKLKYTGWGNFSEKFLRGMEGVDKATGELYTIMGALRQTQYVLMELLADSKFTFAEEIVEHNGVGVERKEIAYDLVEDLYVSPVVKHEIWQTLVVIDELCRIMGHDPARIFVEMARGPEEKKEQKASRQKQLLALYKECKSDDRNWVKEIEDTPERMFRSDRLYFYYTQRGRCMYCGKAIDLDNLYDSNVYDIDHIFPQSLTKDDSLNNRVLTCKTCNGRKENHYPILPDIQASQSAMWKSLLDSKLISEVKYQRLTRKERLTEEELSGFIARQIVETRQTTKAVAEVLRQVCPASKPVYSKAKNVSEFRQKNEFVKVRSVNDLHHAKDAYLNIVVGNVYYTKFTSSPANFIKNYRDAKAEENDYGYNLKTLYRFDVTRDGKTAWVRGKEGTIKTVQQTMAKDNILFTRPSYVQKGALFDQTMYGKEAAKEGTGYIPLKGEQSPLYDMTKYGGYRKAAGAYFFVVEHLQKKKRVRTLEYVPVYMKAKIKDKEDLLQYCIQELGLVDPTIILEQMKMYSLVKINGYPAHITGRSKDDIMVRSAVQLHLDNDDYLYAKKIENLYKKICENSAIDVMEEKDKVSRRENIEFYKKIKSKHEKSIYKKRPNNSVRRLILEGEGKFESLEIKEQVDVLMKMLSLMQCENNGIDFTLLGGKKNVGKTSIKKNILLQKSFVLVNQSPTGIFETEIDLLKP